MRWTIGASWVAFAFLLLVLGQQFLYACGIHIGPYAWRECPAQSDWLNDTRDIRENDRLQRLVHAVELRLAEKPPCDAPPPTDEEFARLAGAQKGRLEVTLSWDTLDDLDLSIDCPGGTIGGQNNPDRGCGDGRREVDSNNNLVENVRAPAVEHAFWQKPPKGDYRFRAQLFKPIDGGTQHEIPFRMTVKFDDKTITCLGAIPFYPMSLNLKTANGDILHSRSAAISWRMDGPLPSCNWVATEIKYCDAGKVCPKN